MSIKTILLVVATLAVVTSILATVWDLSGSLITEQGNVPAQADATVKPTIGIEANSTSETGPSVSNDQVEEPQNVEVQPAEQIKDGVYDDKWVGTPEQVEALSAKHPPDPDSKPKVERPKDFENVIIKDPHAPDDRETAKPRPEPKTVEQKHPGGATADPYEGDDRETN